MNDFSFIPGESFNGSVARWAAENDYERMFDLTQHAGVDHAHRQGAARTGNADIEALAQEMEVDPADLFTRATPLDGPFRPNASRLLFFGTSLPSVLIEKRARRVAPEALRVSAHHRAMWDVRLFPICLETGQTLSSHCPSCKALLGWHHTMGIENCEHCMLDLSEARVESVSDHLRIAVSEIAALIHWDDGKRAAALEKLPSPLASLGSGAAFELLIRLLPVVDRTVPTKLLAVFQMPAERLCSAIVYAWELMLGWPSSLTRLMGKHMAERTGRHSDGNGGRTNRFFRTHRDADGISPALRDLIDGLRQSLDLEGANGEAIRASTYSAKEAAARLSIGTAEFTSLRRCGVLETFLAFNRNRAEPRFPRTEIDNLVGVKADRAAVATTAAELDISNHGVEQMLALKLLSAHVQPYTVMRYGDVQVSRSSITRFLADLSSAATRQIDEADVVPADHPIRLRDAMKAIGGRLKPWGPVYRDLLAGKIPFSLRSGTGPLSTRILLGVGANDAVRGIVFDRADPGNAIYGQSGSLVTYADMMSKDNAREALNVGTKEITSMLARFPTKRGGAKRVAPVVLIEELARVHITAIEIASRSAETIGKAHRRARDAKVPWLGLAGYCRATAERKLFG